MLQTDKYALSRDFIIDFYTKQLLINGNRPEALRWSATGQSERYKTLLDIAGNIDEQTVLDFGCGMGHLFGYIRSQGMNADYTGLDITPPFIELATRKYPTARFELRDVQNHPLSANERFDYIFICGVFNNRIEGATESFLDVIKILYPHCRTRMIVNGLASRTHDTKSFELNYIDVNRFLDNIKRHVTHSAVEVEHSVSGDFFITLDSSSRE